MYRVPANLDLNEIIGSELEGIRLGAHQVQFHFGSRTVIYVQSRATVLHSNSAVAQWSELGGWDNLAFQRLVGCSVLGYSVPNDRLIEIRLSGGLALQLHDDSDQYESMQISRGDVANMVVI
jgi:hypothetical protein